MNTNHALFIAIISLVGTSTLFAQDPKFEWVKQIGGTNTDFGLSIATDADGNVYTTGEFKGAVDFDPGAGTLVFTSVASSISSADIFIQKLDSAGNLLWAKQMGGEDSDRGSYITIDADGNVYTIASFGETVDFDPGAGTFDLVSIGASDIFIQKLNSSGNFLWAKQIAGTSYGDGYSITTDADGNVFATGYFDGTADFDPGAGTFNITAGGYEECFILKLNSAGTFLWANSLTGVGVSSGASITTDANGDVYTTGNFRDTVDFDPGVGVFDLMASTQSDIFIQKLTFAGAFLWAKNMGGTSYNNGESVAIDANGNAYITGYFQGSTDFDPGVGTFILTTSGGTSDVFIQKLNSAGNLLWVKQIDGTHYDNGFSVATDAYGNVYTTGRFGGTVDFDPGNLAFDLSSAGSSDIFIQKLDSDGDFVFAKKWEAQAMILQQALFWMTMETFIPRDILKGLPILTQVQEPLI